MVSRHKLFILIPAIILIPILLGITPMNMIHKLGSGGPFTHGKQTQLSNHCLFHSLISHNDLAIVHLDSIPLGQDSTPSLDIGLFDLDSTYSNTATHSVPLRC
jgi:hypothetical protein